MDNKIYGIDLGTTNSCISILERNRPRVIPVDGNGIVPSVVSLDGERFLIGRQALNRSLAFPEESIKSVKRLMGGDSAIKLGKESFRPEEISAKILGFLVSEAKKLEGHEVRKAVITVPAYFSDAQRRATVEAGTLAGLKVERIINEPTAAALFYDQVQVKSADQDKGFTHTLVYDLGGGTFDVSVLRLGEIIEVISSTGDSRLGGDDFDSLLTRLLLDHIREKHGVDLSDYPPATARLAFAAEKAKIELSTKAKALIEEGFIPVKGGRKTVAVSLEITRTELEQLSGHLIAKTLDFVEKALKEAALASDSIDRVIMVGGMTRMPLITQALSKVFGQSQMPAVDPDLSVANGAAIQGGIINGEAIDQILVDVTSHTLSLAAISGDHLRCVPIIPRNTSIPASRSRIFYTMADDQKKVLLRIYQGESEKPSENSIIGLENLRLAPSPRGTQLEVEYSYDLNGIVHIVAEQRGYGRKAELNIDSRNPSEISMDDDDDLSDGFFKGIFGNSGFDDDDDDYGDEDEDDFAFTGDEDGPDPDDGGQASKPVVNFIIRQAENILEGPVLGGQDKDDLSGLLAEYREALGQAEPDDDAIDALETRLSDLIER
ncbi:MAG: Hsp70 family protein, partial [Deltaproteobacteria bacterium]|nr:Hsp70 family protein [Deltaproteobacteria bacterium]